MTDKHDTEPHAHDTEPHADTPRRYVPTHGPVETVVIVEAWYPGVPFGDWRRKVVEVYPETESDRALDRAAHLDETGWHAEAAEVDRAWRDDGGWYVLKVNSPIFHSEWEKR